MPPKKPSQKPTGPNTSRPRPAPQPASHRPNDAAAQAPRRPSADNGARPGRAGDSARNRAGDSARNRAGDSARNRASQAAQATVWGVHPVMAALDNPHRVLTAIYLSREQAGRLGPEVEQRLAALRRSTTPIYLASREDLAALCGGDAVHQGIALAAEPLAEWTLEELPALIDPARPSRLLVLDQVSDPHNVGAILRSAAVFGADAVIAQDRYSPELTPTLLKSASGAAELLPLVRVTNIARTCAQLAEADFDVIGLAAEGSQSLAAIPHRPRTALVLGAEGSGLRRLVRENCTALAHLPSLGSLTHLNVSNAAAVALYELVRG